MTDSLNVNILVSAKDEYTKQFIRLLCPEIYTVINGVFIDSQKLKKLKSVSLKNFQVLLKKIPLWNSIIIDKNINNIKIKIPYLLDLITAIFVSNIKILSSIRLNKDSNDISIKIPDIDIFLHKIIITISEKFYYNPEIILEKKNKIYEFISNKIEESIRSQIPIDTLLLKYLSGVFQDLNNTNKEISKPEPESESDPDSEKEYDLDSASDEEPDIEQKNIETTRPIKDYNKKVPEIETTEIELPEIETTNYNQNEGVKKKILFNDAKDNVDSESESEL